MFLFKLYKEIEPINNDIRSIQYGGCGVFALSLYNLLKKLNRKPTIVVVTGKRAIKWIDAWVGNVSKCEANIEAHHIVIKLGKSYIDNNGIYNDWRKIEHCDERNQVIYENLPVEVLEEWVNKFTWNHRFYMKEHRPLLENKIANIYNKFNKSLVVSK